MQNTPIILQAKSLKKAFYSPKHIDILTGIDLTVHRGDTLAIMGRSGQGKSTLLQILGTLDSPCSGTLEIDGTLITRFNKSRIRNKKLGFVFQSFHLLDDYTALENVLMPAKIGRQSTNKGSEAYLRAEALLEHVGLADRIHYNTKLLSGGEKQRVAIARAFCNDPDIIFADEPSGNLDKQTSDHIHELLLSYAQQNGKTVIVVTHNTDLAHLCNKRLELFQGQLLIQSN